MKLNVDLKEFKKTYNQKKNQVLYFKIKSKNSFEIENLINNYNIDKNRIYLVGLSMGGYGTFDLISKKPNLFAAAVPICGGANLNILQNSINIPHWIFHGELDRVVPVQESRRAFNFLNERNSIHRYTEYKNTYHNSWDNVFDDSEFMNWLFSFSK